MIFFNENSKLAEIIDHDHMLLPVINRLGVKLGFENQTIKQACKKQNLDIQFFIEIINVFHNENYFPEKKLVSFPVILVVDYLKATHNYYTEFVIPEIERLIEKLINNKLHPESEIIRKFFKKYKEELSSHIGFEEKKVFPYVLKLNAASNSEINKEIFLNEYSNFTIQNFEDEHSDIDEKILDLKNIIIKYLPPDYNTYIRNALLSHLILFDKDLKSHTRIEDKILIPKVKSMEKGLHKL